MIQKRITIQEIQRLDRFAIEKIGVPSCVLMENAGRYVAEEVQKAIKKTNKKVCVVCGVGNNAGDGFVAARHLYVHKVPTRVFLIGKPSALKNNAAANYRILRKIGHPVYVLRRTDSSFRKALKEADLIVDAIFGVGLNRKVEGLFFEAIEAINEAKRKVISVDVPSGLDASRGEVLGTCINASTTVTFMFPKKGFYRGQGPKHRGRVITVDIGIPSSLVRKI